MKRKSKFFVFEARRLVPLLFLLVLLLGLTVYDNFFRVRTTTGPVELDEGLAFTTTDWGEISPPASFTVVGDYDEWIRVSGELGLNLPDYPFDAAEEVAVFAVNGEIQRMDVLPRPDEVGIQVLVEPMDKHFHVVTVARQAVDHENAVWEFVDNQGQVLSRITPFWQKNGEPGQEELQEEEEEEKVVK